jgi:dihydroorotase
VDTIASDHAPHSLEEKNAESIWDVKPGIAGLETMLPLLLTQINKGRLTMKQLVQLTCENPARIYSIGDRGSLKKGSIADITVIDLRKEHRIDASNFRSKAKFSPFNGWKTKGMPVKTFVNGQLAMDNGALVSKPGAGRIIR